MHGLLGHKGIHDSFYSLTDSYLSYVPVHLQKAPITTNLKHMLIFLFSTHYDFIQTKRLKIRENTLYLISYINII